MGHHPNSQSNSNSNQPSDTPHRPGAANPRLHQPCPSLSMNDLTLLTALRQGDATATTLLQRLHEPPLSVPLQLAPLFTLSPSSAFKALTRLLHHPTPPLLAAYHLTHTTRANPHVPRRFFTLTPHGHLLLQQIAQLLSCCAAPEHAVPQPTDLPARVLDYSGKRSPALTPRLLRSWKAKAK